MTPWHVIKYPPRPQGSAEFCFVFLPRFVAKRIRGSLQKYGKYNRIKIDQLENRAGTNSTVNQDGGMQKCAPGGPPQFSEMGCKLDPELPVSQSEKGNPPVTKHTSPQGYNDPRNNSCFF